MAGEIADFSSFSFHAVKNFTTAEGGALTWNLPFGNEQVPTDADYMPTVPKKEWETWNELLYRGVMRPYPHPRSKEAIEGFASYRGSQSGCNYAETFEVVLRRI